MNKWFVTFTRDDHKAIIDAESFEEFLEKLSICEALRELGVAD